jgi:putative CocE/NonD family hydrolase
MPKYSSPQFRVLVEKNVAMPTRDGVTLRADIYRPDAPGRFPVLLSRLPYNKDLRPRPGDIDYFVERGYGVIMQDTRGRFASEGEEYYALIWEMQDGYDAVEWAAGLPWADGNVGTTGQSYLGATQYLLAPTRPPHLKAAFPVSAAADFHQSWVYHTGGAFEHAGASGTERATPADARTGPRCGTDAVCPTAVRGRLSPSAANGLGRPVAPGGALSDRLFAPSR